MSRDGNSHIDEAVTEIVKCIEEGKANSDGTCKKEGCNGRVVKRLMSIFHGQHYYDTPECDKCGRTYPFEKNATAVGHMEVG